MIRRHLREWSVALSLGVLLLVLRWLAPRFFEPVQLKAILVSSAPILVMAVGMTLVILARHIDISIGSQYSICGVVAGLVAQAGLPQISIFGVAMPTWVPAALLMGALLGAANGVLVAWLNLPSIVVTLATMVIWQEALNWGRQGEAVLGLPGNFQWFGAGLEVGQWLVVGIALAVFLVFAWGLRYLAMGRAVYATGSNEEAARLAGIHPKWVVFGVFVLMGFLTGLAALLNSVRFPVVYPNAGTGLELQVIAAVVVGGVAISGGRGTLAGSLVGVALLAVIGPALQNLNTSPQWAKAIQGGIILVAVASDALERRR